MVIPNEVWEYYLYILPSLFLFVIYGGILLKVNRIQLMKILEKMRDVARKTDEDDYDIRLRACEIGTRKITQGISDKEKIKEIEGLVLGFYALMSEKGGILSYLRRIVYMGEAMNLIEAVFDSIE